MSTADLARELPGLLKRLKSAYPDAACPCAQPVIDPEEPILGEFLRSFLIWESTTPRAATALRSVERSVVDFNELRICLAHDFIGMLGPRFPGVEQRALRIRAALSDIYLREHAVTLRHLADMPKRKARSYLESLEGVPHFVASRVVLVALGGHAAPIDSRILSRLCTASALPQGLRPESAAGLIERAVRAGELAEVYALLQAWSDDGSPEPQEDPRPQDRSRAPRRSTARRNAKASPAANDPKPAQRRKKRSAEE